jgi:hypothetical protein
MIVQEPLPEDVQAPALDAVKEAPKATAAGVEPEQPVVALPEPEVPQQQPKPEPQIAQEPVLPSDQPGLALPVPQPQDVQAPPLPPAAAAAEEVLQPRKKARTSKKPLAPLPSSSENVPLTTRRAARLKDAAPAETTADKGKSKGKGKQKQSEPLPGQQQAEAEDSLEGHVKRYPKGHNIELK